MAIRYKKYIIRLSADERQRLSKVACSGKAAARKITRSRVLLKAGLVGRVSGSPRQWTLAFA